MFLTKNTIVKAKKINCTKIALIFKPKSAKIISVKFFDFFKNWVIFSRKERFLIKIRQIEGRTRKWAFQTQ